MGRAGVDAIKNRNTCCPAGTRTPDCQASSLVTMLTELQLNIWVATPHITFRSQVACLSNTVGPPMTTSDTSGRAWEKPQASPIQWHLQLPTRHFRYFVIYVAMQGHQNVSGGRGGAGRCSRRKAGRPDRQTDKTRPIVLFLSC